MQPRRDALLAIFPSYDPGMVNKTAVTDAEMNAIFGEGYRQEFNASRELRTPVMLS
jgi:hypothetical protein